MEITLPVKAEMKHVKEEYSQLHSFRFHSTKEPRITPQTSQPVTVTELPDPPHSLYNVKSDPRINYRDVVLISS